MSGTNAFLIWAYLLLVNVKADGAVLTLPLQGWFSGKLTRLCCFQHGSCFSTNAGTGMGFWKEIWRTKGRSAVFPCCLVPSGPPRSMHHYHFHRIPIPLPRDFSFIRCHNPVPPLWTSEGTAHQEMVVRRGKSVHWGFQSLAWSRCRWSPGLWVSPLLLEWQWILIIGLTCIQRQFQSLARAHSSPYQAADPWLGECYHGRAWWGSGGGGPGELCPWWKFSSISRGFCSELQGLSLLPTLWSLSYWISLQCVTWGLPSSSQWFSLHSRTTTWALESPVPKGPAWPIRLEYLG